MMNNWSFRGPEAAMMGGGWGGPMSSSIGRGPDTFASPEFARMLAQRMPMQMPFDQEQAPVRMAAQFGQPMPMSDGMPMEQGPIRMAAQFGQPLPQFNPGLTNTFQKLKANRLAAETFGRRPAPQGEAGPGMRGEAGGSMPMLGRRFVANNFRTQAPGVR